MKSALFFILAFLFLAGAVIFFNPSPKTPAPSLASDPPSSTPTPAPSLIPNPAAQIIKATYGPPLGFYPTTFTVKAGTPVRLEVTATADGRGCMGSIMIPKLAPNNIQFFAKGKTNIFEFAPQTPGEYPITCGMGIPHGFITVK